MGPRAGPLDAGDLRPGASRRDPRDAAADARPRARDRADVLLVQRREPAHGDRAAPRHAGAGDHHGRPGWPARFLAVAARLLDADSLGRGAARLPPQGDPRVLPAAVVPDAAPQEGDLARRAGEPPRQRSLAGPADAPGRARTESLTFV